MPRLRAGRGPHASPTTRANARSNSSSALWVLVGLAILALNGGLLVWWLGTADNHSTHHVVHRAASREAFLRDPTAGAGANNNPAPRLRPAAAAGTPSLTPLPDELPVDTITTPRRATMPTRPVHHLWTHSSDGKFALTDAYVLRDRPGGPAVLALLGDGILPVQFPTPTSYTSSLVCDFAAAAVVATTTTKASVRFMRHKLSDSKRQYAFDYEHGSTPGGFTHNAGAMHTQLVLCPVPEGVAATFLAQARARERSLSESKRSHNKRPEMEPLFATLRDSGGGDVDTFSLSIPRPRYTNLQLPTRAPAARQPADGGNVLACLCPLYGIKGTRWLIEWIEYHRAIGVAHVHAYVNDVSKAARAALELYAREGFATLHDWSDKRFREAHDGQKGGARFVPYERMKFEMMTDCALRALGRYAFALVLDIDELLAVPAVAGAAAAPPLAGFARWATAQFDASGGAVWGFSVESKTSPPLYDDCRGHHEIGAGAGGASAATATARDPFLMIERIQALERRCDPKHTCGKFHKGRQKFLLRTSGTRAAPLRWLLGGPAPGGDGGSTRGGGEFAPLWTHAISRDLALSEAQMRPVANEPIDHFPLFFPTHVAIADTDHLALPFLLALAGPCPPRCCTCATTPRGGTASASSAPARPTQRSTPRRRSSCARTRRSRCTRGPRTEACRPTRCCGACAGRPACGARTPATAAAAAKGGSTG